MFSHFYPKWYDCGRQEGVSTAWVSHIIRTRIKQNNYHPLFAFFQVASFCFVLFFLLYNSIPREMST